MNYLHEAKHWENKHQNGLTASQWVVLAVAFVVGVGSTFVVREIFPPASAQAGVVPPSGLLPRTK